jgi:hypothetical protein
MRRSLLIFASALTLLLLAAACGSSSNKNNTNANNAAQPNNPNSGPILGQASYVPTEHPFTPIPGSTAIATPYPVPSGTPPVGVPNPCVALSNGPLPPNATLPAATPIAAFAPGPQPVRPPVDFSKLDLSKDTIPSGFDVLNDGRVDAQNLAGVAAYPQYSYAFLQTIGFLGGRARSWTQGPTNSRYSLLALYYFAFNNDAGASAFLQSPVTPAAQCFKEEPGAAIGQETRHDSFQYAGKLQNNAEAIYEGHDAIWRCGRVLLSVQLVGAPNQYNAAAVDALAQKVQADYLKSGQPCS